MKRVLLAVCLTVMMMFVAAPGAQAVIYNITSQHFNAGPAGTIFGTVAVVQDGTSVDFTVTLNNGSLFVRTGAGDFQNFLFNATGVVAGDISGTGLTASPSLLFPAPLSADGTGDWMFGVFKTGQATGGGDGYGPSLTFTVANATIAEVTGGNGSNIFAIDILSGYSGLTGMVDVSTPPQVPEASALVLLSTGLAGLVVWRRKKRFE